ncbi:hypothetical protein HMPREF1624_03584 [Sporothrix schenckii ATCC 58251]|uniref:TATA element modulatory factor 1 TATA binding domain-containing protein n=1 Tax=Sporothrix schenckii (strain ATCC 58251 / de Perez 2211183) TaxID=1391915 RepID=U7PX90_SPOS1|nr:hypothetical protein HMPREF1624_03584 [Sporothrix schenckii ATCC 58251]
MASSTPAKGGSGTRWGSLLSQAVAGVEARLDTILSDADDSTKPQEQKPPAKPAAPAKPNTARSGSSNRANDRLQERLARAVAAKSGAPSPSLGSSAASASAANSPRQSLDVPSRASIDSTASGSKDAPAGDAAAARKSTDGSKRPSFEASTEIKDEIKAEATATNGDGAAATDEARASPESSTATTNHESNDNAAAPSTPNPMTTLTTTAADAASTSADDTTVAATQSTAASAAALDAVRESRIKQLEAELLEQRRQHQDEIHHHTEKTEMLQAKVQYLASEAAEAAKKAVADAAPGSLEKKVAEQDQKIAQIMLEGKNLSVMEEKHRAILKKLRVKISDDEKEIAEFKTARTKTEGELQTLRARARRAAELERAQEEGLKRLSQVHKELEGLRSDAVSKDATIADLRQQVKTANEHAEATKIAINDAALEKERQRVKELEEQVATAQLEKSLAADRAKAQIKEWQEKADKAAERTRTVEQELQNELQLMESKLEAMRGRAEEASSGATGDSHAKLMRQVETLQSQYSIASDNWQGIETTLLARVSNLEKERDEALQRESEMRKKAREAALRAKRNEEDLEEARFKLPRAHEHAGAYEAQIEALKKRAEEAEAARDQLKTELDEAVQQKAAAWKEDKHHHGERDRRGDANDRGNWLESLPNIQGLPPMSPVPPQLRGSSSRPETPLLPNPSRTWSSELLGFQGLPNKLRKASAPSSQDDPTERFSLRRPSGQPPGNRPLSSLLGSGSNSGGGLPLVFSPTTETGPGGAGSLTSSVYQQPRHASVVHSSSGGGGGGGGGGASTTAGNSTTHTTVDQDDPLEGMERSASPQQALMQDMVSVSTVAAGPSVQLVERMSAAIRRLESEKVAAREELARISKQRNEARAEVLQLIKDTESGRAAVARVTELEAQVGDLQARYDTTLELLGEKSELVEELRADVQDVKAMYRDLVERTVQ